MVVNTGHINSNQITGNVHDLITGTGTVCLSVIGGSTPLFVIIMRADNDTPGNGGAGADFHIIGVANAMVVEGNDLTRAAIGDVQSGPTNNVGTLPFQGPAMNRRAAALPLRSTATR